MCQREPLLDSRLRCVLDVRLRGKSMKIKTYLGLLAVVAGIGLAGKAAAQSRYVNASELNCRAERSTSAAVIARFSQGMQVDVAETREGWSRVERRPTCWVNSRYLVEDRALGLIATRTTPQRPSARSSERGNVSQRSRSQGGGSGARSSRPRQYAGGSCPCSGSNICIGPRGGRYCITSGGNKRYGV